MKTFSIVIYIFLVSKSYLFAQELYFDYDLDGVDDNVDKCLNTPFEYEVDEYGCPKNVLDNITTRVSIEYSYNKQSETSYLYKYSLKTIDLYLGYKNYTFGISKSYISLLYDDYTYDETYDIKGYSDLSVDFGYHINYHLLKYINIQTKLKNTSSNDTLSSDKNDYTISLYFKHNYADTDIFNLISYNIVADTDNINYKNYFDTYTGFSRRLYSIYYSIGVLYSQKNLDELHNHIDIKTNISIPINSDISASSSYTKGISNYNNYNSFSFKLTYSF
jgi:hypothetical protein